MASTTYRTILHQPASGRFTHEEIRAAVIAVRAALAKKRPRSKKADVAKPSPRARSKQ